MSKYTSERDFVANYILPKLRETIENERRVQKDLDETIYDNLGLKPNERKQIEHGLLELQEIRRLRTQV
ncbi:MAG: hypothetical protein H3Z53_00070 [archaeon]|nr:hypothetical protein [archaeon]MCP8312760.1 hypothetical protein [archaeon]MCP8322468.1 hypothetical protein [archaeon]